MSVFSGSFLSFAFWAVNCDNIAMPPSSRPSKMKRDFMAALLGMGNCLIKVKTRRFGFWFAQCVPGKLLARRQLGAGVPACPLPTAGGDRLWTSKIKAIDVLLVEDERRAEQDVVPLDFDVADSARLHRSIAGAQRSAFEAVGCLDRQIAEVHRVPEDHAIGDALVDVLFVVIGQAQADDLHVFVRGLIDRLRGRRDSPINDPTLKSMPPATITGVSARASKPSSTLRRTISKALARDRKFVLRKQKTTISAASRSARINSSDIGGEAAS